MLGRCAAECWRNALTSCWSTPRLWAEKNKRGGLLQHNRWSVPTSLDERCNHGTGGCSAGASQTRGEVMRVDTQHKQSSHKGFAATGELAGLVRQQTKMAVGTQSTTQGRFRTTQGRRMSASTWRCSKHAVDGAAALLQGVTIMRAVVTTLRAEFGTPHGVVT